MPQERHLPRLLEAIAVAANEASTAGEAMRTALREVCAAMRWPLGHAYRLRDDDAQALDTVAWYPETADEPDEFAEFRRASDAIRRIPPHSMIARVVTTATPHWWTDVSQDRSYTRAEEAARVGLRAALAFPVLAGRDVAGVLEFYATRPIPPDQRVLEVMAAVGTQLGRVIERERADRERAALLAAERQVSRQLRLILDATGEGVFGIDLDGRFTFVNRAAARLLASTPEELSGLPVHDTLHHSLPDGSPYPEEHCVVLEALRTGSPLGARDEVFWRRDGAALPVDFSAHPVEDEGRLTGAVVRFVDVSERQRSDRARRESEQVLIQLMESLPIAVFVTDAQGAPFYANEAARAVLGTQVIPDVPLEELASEYRAYVAGSDDLYPVERMPLVRALRGEASTVEDLEILRNGERKLLRVAARPIRDAEGRVVRAVAVFDDISEQRRAAAAAMELKEAAEKANRAKSEFLSRMSHELRTPLNAILGFAQLLELEALTPTQLDSVQQILKAGRHLLDLINEVLDIARIEAGQLFLSIETVALDEVVRAAVDLVRPLAAERGVTLVGEDAAEGLHAVADAQRLKQALLNLLANGVKYNRPGGTVTVEAERVGEARVRLVVADDGPGIPPEKLDRLFVPFDRLGAEETAVEGTGLGLALSKHLVEAMGGAIGVRSDPHRRTEFCLDLPHTHPRDEHVDQEQIRQRPAPSGHHARKTVLYVEDNLSNVRLVERILAHRPHVTLLPVMQGSLGVDLAREHRPDLILLDLNLPDEPGAKVLRRLKADEQTRDIPVVVVTANALAGQAKRLLDDGAHDYLTKPLDIARFLDVVDRVLARAPRR